MEKEKGSAVKPGRTASDVGSLLPFEELVNEELTTCPFKEEEASKSTLKEDSALPNPSALLHVTNRRKTAPKKKSLEVVSLHSSLFFFVYISRFSILLFVYFAEQ